MSKEKVLLDNDPLKRVIKRSNRGYRVQTTPVGESRTNQSFKDQCDVNLIIAKYRKTGEITHVRNVAQGSYMDCASVPEFQEAQNIIARANSLFADVPANIRAHFDHSPEKFFAFLQDDKNAEEAIKMGLATKRPAPKPNADELLAKIVENTTPPVEPEGGKKKPKE
jgi:phage internal scaffolding protein